MEDDSEAKAQAEGGAETEPEPELVACIVASLPNAKEFVAVCEAEEIAAVLTRAECCGRTGCNCAPKIQVSVPREDVPRVAKLLNQRWRQLLEREGTFDFEAAADTVRSPRPAAAGEEDLPEGEHPPCPACGTAAPLVEGACSDCGLQLE